MKEKKQSKIRRKFHSKSEQKRVEASEEKNTNSRPLLDQDSKNAAREGEKSRVTFLVDQMFQGTYYKKGESIKIPEATAKAYSKRSTLKIEKA